MSCWTRAVSIGVSAAAQREQDLLEVFRLEGGDHIHPIALLDGAPDRVVAVQGNVIARILA